MNRLSIKGRATVLFLLAIMVSLIIPSFCETEKWETVAFEPVTEHNGIIATTNANFAIELWHYSGGYWGNNQITISDSLAFDDPDKLADAVITSVKFEIPIPAAVKAAVNNGEKVIVQCEANQDLDYRDLFSLSKASPQFSLSNDKVYFKAYPKFNFLTGVTYSKFVAGLNKKIPFVNPAYGYNRYSIWTRSGDALGAANNYINPKKLSELGPVGTIHPSQITGSSGDLDDGFKVKVTNLEYVTKDYDSKDVSIGHGTFDNAGAVAVHFWYPLKVTFYRGIVVTNDVAVTKIEKSSYPASQGVRAEVTVKNYGTSEITSSLKFTIPGIANELESVTLKANESKILKFSFETPSNGTIAMTADLNAERAFEEVDYNNNRKTVNATIETPPSITETSNCSDTIVWTETASHRVTYPCENHGSHTYTCTHTFTYETQLTSNYSLAPRSLKSGYGFSVLVNNAISTHLISNSGCGEWGDGRQPSNKPSPPSKGEVRLSYRVTNKLGTQPYTVQLQQAHLGSTTSSFEPKANNISEIRAKKIYTDVALKGTANAPARHYFDVYISGGGVNGVEFCKTFRDYITINGNMYEDDFTGSK
jgi:hypothetical protein